MSSNVKLRIPENLNIEEIIKENAVAFHGNNLKKEKLIFIIDAYLKSRAQNRKEINDRNEATENVSQFVPLSTEYLQEVVHDYNLYLNYLLANGVLLTDNHFIVGEKCRWYCLDAPYLGQRLKTLEVDSFTLRKAIRNARERRDEEVKKAMWGYGYLIKWWETGKLEIDLEEAHLWIEQYEKIKIERIELNEAIIDKEWAIKNAIDTTEDFKNLTNAINTKKHRYAFSGEGHRFYNPISSLKKELRGFLTYDGKPLVDIDLKNSQPFLATALFKSSFWEYNKEGSGQNLTLEGISKEIYEEVRNNNKYKHIITLLKTSESLTHTESPFKKFTDLVINGTFYEYIQEHFEPLYPTKFDTRGKVKVAVLTIFYIENYIAVHFKQSQTFKEHFPEVYELFRLIKGIQHNYLPIILQRIESFLVIDVVCKTLSKQHPQTPVFTIHDNIITTKGNEGIVRDVMSSEIESWVGYEPSLGCGDLEYWKVVPDFEGYEVSSIGNVRGIERKVRHSTWERTVNSKDLVTRINNRGYKDVRLSKEGTTFTKLVHILTAEAFVSNHEGKPNVNHMDGNKLNNHFKNLSWVTHSENIQHAYDTSLVKKMKSKKVIDTCTGELYPSIKEAAKAINISYGTCRNYLNGNIKTNKTCLKLAS